MPSSATSASCVTTRLPGCHRHSWRGDPLPSNRPAAGHRVTGVRQDGHDRFPCHIGPLQQRQGGVQGGRRPTRRRRCPRAGPAGASPWKASRPTRRSLVDKLLPAAAGRSRRRCRDAVLSRGAAGQHAELAGSTATTRTAGRRCFSNCATPISVPRSRPRRRRHRPRRRCRSRSPRPWCAGERDIGGGC